MDGETANLLEFLLALRLDRVREFLELYGLPKSGTRAELRERLSRGLTENAFSTVDIVDFLDRVEPWSKQHVFLYDGSAGLVDGWDSLIAMQRRLAEAGVADLLNERLPIVLPKNLTLSSIRYEGERFLVVTAVEGRTHQQRDTSRDRTEVDDAGRTVDLLAFVRVTTRGLFVFRWDLLVNIATLHIMQAESGYDYEEAEQRFAQLAQSFLQFERFRRADIRVVIRRLHDLEGRSMPEARSHRLGYRTRGGRTIEAASPTRNDSVTGEAQVDRALTSIAAASTGRVGNFYWLAGAAADKAANPLIEDLHLVVVASESRVNFMVPSSREAITYVLQRIRALSQRNS